LQALCHDWLARKLQRGPMLYQSYQAHSDLMWPARALARASVPLLDSSHASQRQWAAACEVLRLAEVTHRRPDWGIASVAVDGELLPVVEEEIMREPFCTLRRFAKPSLAATQPKVLIVAPMSGHFATLLRDTVRTMLPDHDVHVTDWHNARDVPLSAGPYGLAEYTATVMRCLEAMGPGSHLMAICQPCVAALAATALMSQDEHPATPASLTLMAGPIDCRIAPTAVNTLANDKPIEWFERNLINHVPLRHRGAGRRVYPGFVQLSAFMSMNRERHVNAFRDYYLHLVAQDSEKATTTRAFYEEYMAVADLPAEFFLQTVQLIFQEYRLARGELTLNGRHVDPSAIRRTAVITIEGERDDICAPGQTLAAQDLCTKVKPFLRTHYVQPGVGHYGVFSGRRWQRHIYPLVRNVIHTSRWT
jgi:poly(3-hydroxybutyrate) depolymerase